MRQLTYISSVAPDMQIDLSKILELSRRNNTRDSLTGLLLHDGVRFLQTLEGDPVILQWTFDRISRDARHRAVVILSDHEIPMRQFGRWAMACEQLSADRDETLIERVDAMTEAVTDRNLRAHFRSFARINRRAA